MAIRALCGAIEIDSVELSNQTFGVTMFELLLEMMEAGTLPIPIAQTELLPQGLINDEL